MVPGPPFLRLPTEIRLQIYGYLYIPPEGQPPVEATFSIWGPAPTWIHKLELRHNSLHVACNTTKRAFWSILQVCKQVNREVEDLLYERLIFVILVTNKRMGDPLPAEAPRLGLAKDLTFWQRTQRILIVSLDVDEQELEHTTLVLGRVFRCFKSTPLNTTTVIYLRENLQTRLLFGSTGPSRRGWRRPIEGLTSLSKRTEFDFEVRTHQPLQDLERFMELVDAVNGSAKLITVRDGNSGFPKLGRDDIVLSTEVLRRRTKAESLSGANGECKKRVICWMSARARYRAGRIWAIERKRKFVQQQKAAKETA